MVAESCTKLIIFLSAINAAGESEATEINGEFPIGKEWFDVYKYLVGMSRGVIIFLCWNVNIDRLETGLRNYNQYQNHLNVVNITNDSVDLWSNLFI